MPALALMLHSEGPPNKQEGKFRFYTIVWLLEWVGLGVSLGKVSLQTYATTMLTSLLHAILIPSYLSMLLHLFELFIIIFTPCLSFIELRAVY